MTIQLVVDHTYFKKYYKMIAKKINFTANLDTGGNTRLHLILEEERETIFEFSQGTVKVL